MARNSKIELKEDFVDFTGTTTANAGKWLEAYNWKLEDAIDAYLNKKANGNTSASVKIDPKVADIFNLYEESSDPEIIGIDGTIKYIEQLGFELEDVATLCLAEFLESPSVGTFTKTKFLSKWSRERITNLPGMAKYIEGLRSKLFHDEAYFKRIYTFTFTFLLEENQRILPLELATDYWTLLLNTKYPQEVESWAQFLNAEWKKPITKDCWNMFYLFIQEFHMNPKLENYDETAAWPSIMDQFVEYLKGPEQEQLM